MAGGTCIMAGGSGAAVGSPGSVASMAKIMAGSSLPIVKAYEPWELEGWGWAAAGTTASSLGIHRVLRVVAEGSQRLSQQRQQ